MQMYDLYKRTSICWKKHQGANFMLYSLDLSDLDRVKSSWSFAAFSWNWFPL